MKRTVEAIIFLAFGAMLASVAWAGFTPDQPAQYCVPLYDKLPLECVQC